MCVCQVQLNCCCSGCESPVKIERTLESSELITLVSFRYDCGLFLRVVVSLAVSSGVTSLVQYPSHACLNVKKSGTFALDWSIIAVEETN